MDNRILFGLGICLGLYVLVRIIATLHKPNKNFNKELQEILTSDEYKVKGQYD